LGYRTHDHTICNIFYTHLSDRFAPFYTKVIAATASEALHVLDGLLTKA
jgi:TnpA family transposase